MRGYTRAPSGASVSHRVRPHHRAAAAAAATSLTSATPLHTLHPVAKGTGTATQSRFGGTGPGWRGVKQPSKAVTRSLRQRAGLPRGARNAAPPTAPPRTAPTLPQKSGHRQPLAGAPLAPLAHRSTAAATTPHYALTTRRVKPATGPLARLTAPPRPDNAIWASATALRSAHRAGGAPLAATSAGAAQLGTRHTSRHGACATAEGRERVRPASATVRGVHGSSGAMLRCARQQRRHTHRDDALDSVITDSDGSLSNDTDFGDRDPVYSEGTHNGTHGHTRRPHSAPVQRQLSSMAAAVTFVVQEKGHAVRVSHDVRDCEGAGGGGGSTRVTVVTDVGPSHTWRVTGRISSDGRILMDPQSQRPRQHRSGTQRQRQQRRPASAEPRSRHSASSSHVAGSEGPPLTISESASGLPRTRRPHSAHPDLGSRISSRPRRGPDTATTSTGSFGIPAQRVVAPRKRGEVFERVSAGGILMQTPARVLKAQRRKARDHTEMRRLLWERAVSAYRGVPPEAAGGPLSPTTLVSDLKQAEATPEKRQWRNFLGFEWPQAAATADSHAATESDGDVVSKGQRGKGRARGKRKGGRRVRCATVDVADGPVAGWDDTGGVRVVVPAALPSDSVVLTSSVLSGASVTYSSAAVAGAPAQFQVSPQSPEAEATAFAPTTLPGAGTGTHDDVPVEGNEGAADAVPPGSRT